MSLESIPDYPRRTSSATAKPRVQRGVVLIIALVLLVVISLLAVTSLRNAGSNAMLAGNVRTTELATQAADIALRHCESSVLALMTLAAGGASSYVTSFNASHILAPSDPPKWQNMAFWDGSGSTVFVLPLSLLNLPGISVTYKRAAECMVEPVPVVTSGSAVVSTTPSFVVTARGFGPEVAPVDANRSRPQGSEVWLQSHIELE